MVSRAASMAKKAGTDGLQLVASNARASRRYEIEERLEVGIVLTGAEVKALRTKGADLDGSWASIENGELFVHKLHIPLYEQATAFALEPRRTRKLLAHSQEIMKLHGRLTLRGYTLIPLRVYFKNGRAKVEIGVGKGKDVADKRQDLRAKAAERERRAGLAARRR